MAPAAGFGPYIAGPAIVSFDSMIYYVKDAINIRTNTPSFAVKDAMHGTFDERSRGKNFVISFTPSGELKTMSKYFPYTHADIGKSIFGATDKPLVIATLAGKTYTFARAGMTKMPGLTLGCGNTPFTGMEFRAFLATATEPSTAASFLAIASAAFADVSWDDSTVVTGAYSATWGANEDMDARDGFQIEFGMGLAEHSVDRYGLVDIILTDLIPSARFAPCKVSEADWLGLVIPDGSDVIMPGQSYAVADEDLVITGPVGGLEVTLSKAGLKDYAADFSVNSSRFGECTFIGRTKWQTGVALPPLTFDIVAAPEPEA